MQARIADIYDDYDKIEFVPGVIININLLIIISLSAGLPADLPAETKCRREWNIGGRFRGKAAF
jgi:hypothetical protein